MTTPKITTAQTPAAARPTAHLGNLDALRGIAIVGVVIVHCAGTTLQTSMVSRLWYAASIGVELFYMVSAFTLLMSMDRRTREHRPTANFFVRRFFRIAPLFYIAILLSYLRLRLPFVTGYRPSLAEYGLGFLFLFGFKPVLMFSLVVGGWSIAVETTFYVLLPWLQRAIRSLRVALIAFVVTSLVFDGLSYWLGTRYALDPTRSDYFMHFWVVVQLPVFLAGFVLYFAWRPYLRDQRLPARARLYSGLLATAVLVAFISFHLSRPFDYTPQMQAVDTFLLAGLFFAVLLHPWSVLVNRVTRYLGKISFSIYLLHFFVIETVPKVYSQLLHRKGSFMGLAYGTFPCFLVFLVVGGALAVALSALSFRWIEQPGIRLGRRIIARLEQAEVTKKLLAMPAATSAADTPDAQF